MKIINGSEFDLYRKENLRREENETSGSQLEKTVREIIEAIRCEGDAALRRYTEKFDRRCPENFEVNALQISNAKNELETSDPDLAGALKFSAENLRRFALVQMEQFKDFETENIPGIFTGQKVIPVERAAVYVPGGRFPLISSALMGLVPAFCAGAGEVCLASPPATDALPDRRILAAAGIAAQICGRMEKGLRVFCAGGAQAVAALALGTETIPRCDVIAGPGNKYVVTAKRLIFGEAGIDLLPGPSDILVICSESPGNELSEIAAADMIAQAEHDPDARALALVSSQEAAGLLAEAIEKRLQELPAAEIAKASLEAGGLIIVYKDRDEAVSIANAIAPEHLELQVSDPSAWMPKLSNYGSLFAGTLAAEVLGDYSAGINHTLPTKGTARFTGGLSVRHFLKTLTTLRCENRTGYVQALKAAQTIARAEGLAGHSESAGIRL
ncbi:MAG: histidinol dehydrogenase [Treponema sp.]|jgi:histidinol dehydrogenase|nr:histidinol dehydrogenase [Treponema sp.]